LEKKKKIEKQKKKEKNEIQSYIVGVEDKVCRPDPEPLRRRCWPEAAEVRSGVGPLRLE
jgi:hypothetical protein